jgi:FHA domain
VIICASCKHSEMDGTLFCSECGSRLWGDANTDETANFALGSDHHTDQIGSLIIPTFAPPTSFSIRMTGAKDPILLNGKPEYMLGRSDPKHNVEPDVDLSPYGGQQLGVSRRHATLVLTESGLSIRDHGSTNGTAVNGRVLAANQEWPLRDGDEIRLGKLAFNIFFIIDSNPSPAP